MDLVILVLPSGSCTSELEQVQIQAGPVGGLRCLLFLCLASLVFGRAATLHRSCHGLQHGGHSEPVSSHGFRFVRALERSHWRGRL